MNQLNDEHYRASMPATGKGCRMICVECERPATYSHIGDTVTVYSCEHHCCSACTALDGARDSLMATLTALRDRLREQHLLGADDLDAAIERLAAIERVRELHHFVVDEIETREGTEDVQYCSECGYIPTDEEPCPTIRILDGTENE